VLLTDVATDPERMARFSREAQLLASLNHSNIGSIYGLEGAHGDQALVMELVEGPTLADRLAKDALPIPRHSQWRRRLLTRWKLRMIAESSTAI
jgi:serine/threonine-protein kinase